MDVEELSALLKVFSCARISPHVFSISLFMCLHFSIGQYYFEATVSDEGLCRVGWATACSSFNLGTDKGVKFSTVFHTLFPFTPNYFYFAVFKFFQGFGFGGTGMKSNCKKVSFSSDFVLAGLVQLEPNT